MRELREIARALVCAVIATAVLYWTGLAVALAVGIVLYVGSFVVERRRRPRFATPASQPLLTAARAHADRASPEKRFHFDLAAEQAREREVIRTLHTEYISTHDVGPLMIAGNMALPGEWVVKRLEEMGETFRWGEYKP